MKFKFHCPLTLSGIPPTLELMHLKGQYLINAKVNVIY